jgi:hypothetical protein
MQPEEALRRAGAAPELRREGVAAGVARLAVWLLRLSAALLLALPLLLLALWLSG